MASFYTRLLRQYKFKYQTVFSAKFDEQDKDDQVLEEIELFVNLNFDRNL